jgi:4-amino-4-deoxy-L-arabinose transferase-like glycosyltransferase
MSRRAAAEVGQIVRRIPSALRRVPRAAWICALIACLNAACWSIITPPFQVPDEPSHFAYVQQIAETGTLPTSGDSDYSEEEEVALRDLHHLEVRWHPETHPVATQVEQQTLQHDLAQPLRRSGPGGAGVADSQPPLFYTLQTIPYFLGSSGTLLDRLELMRLLSALMGGLTALFVYLFVREALPGAPWTWAVGGLAVALMPLLGFMSGAVNPDAMLFAVSAAIFYLFARAFRRGLTPRLAIAIGAVTAIGLLTKVNFVGLTPGIGVGLVALTLREARISRGTAYRSLAVAVAIPATPVCLYLVINLLSNHPALGVVTGAIHLTSGRGPLLDEISYIWQFYLPRLPGMTTYFPGISTTLQMWFDRSVGLYGWLDTPFPPWVEHIALIPAVLLAILGIRALITIRATVRRRLVELAVYAVMGVGLLALIGADQYLTYLAKEAQPETYAEPRYLLPLLARLGAALALSARGAGRRWGPAVGVLIVVLFLGHDIFSQLQEISRYYG